jgi:hypothetical protein
MENLSLIHPARPARYQVCLQGQVSSDWSDWLSDLVVVVEDHDQAAVTILNGTVKDQAALFGLLSFIRDLGVPLISINYLPESKIE